MKNENIRETGVSENMYSDLKQYRELVSSTGELYLNLQKLANANVQLKSTMESHAMYAANNGKLNALGSRMESTASDLLASFHEIFRGAKMLLSSEDRREDSSFVNRDLLIMTLDLINCITSLYRQRLIENYHENCAGWNGFDREINTICRLLNVITVIIHLFSENKNALLEGNFGAELENLDRLSERLSYLEDKLKVANKEILMLNKELDQTKRALEFVTLCQESGISRNEYNKIFSDNIEVTLFKKELESLQKQFLEVDQLNFSLEHKVVNLLNEINILVSKNLLLEERLKQFKKPQEGKLSVGSTKHYTKGDLLLQIKEKNETINNMASQNSHLNAMVAELKKDNKICSKSYILSRSAILEKDIQIMKLEHNEQELEMVTCQMEVTINSLERRIEELEMELHRSDQKIQDLYVQLAASETLRISLQVCVDADEQNAIKTKALDYIDEQSIQATSPQSRILEETSCDQCGEERPVESLNHSHSLDSIQMERKVSTLEPFQEEITSIQ